LTVKTIVSKRKKKFLEKYSTCDCIKEIVASFSL